ncbi:VWA domain-containing protein [Nocardioides sp.]|uniref:vWA domain-containing protein n=1 Tax=Nocardioides sp. TaxID=35761 RepID=UPI00351656BE
MSAPAGPDPDPVLAALRPPEEVLLGFTRALRAAGVPVTADRAHTFLDAVARLDLGDRALVRIAGRAALCAGPEDLLRFEQVFAEYFDPRGELPRPRPAPPSPSRALESLSEDDAGSGAQGRDDDVVRARASEVEVLRHRDVAGMTAAEKARLESLFAGLRPRVPLRRTWRHEPWRRGDLDARRTLRGSLRRFGEPARLEHRHRTTRPRRVVLLLDVSGSMTPYADVLLRLAHVLTQAAVRQGGTVETFSVGTRLTHLTRALRTRDAERALVAAGEAVPDWSGGTRLGETLAAFHDRWGRRGLGRGAVIVVFSDGWERGDAALLGEQVRRLRSVAHRLVWVNPHRGKDGYEPVQGGIVAVLPYVDDFVAGHTLATYEELIEVISRA